MVNVLIRIQGESYVTISLCYGYLKALKKSILKSKENGNGMATTLEKILSARFGWMLDVLDSRFDPIYIIAACFDPNTVHLVSKRDLELAISSIQPLIDCQATSGQSTSNVQPTNELDLYLEEIAQKELEQRQSRAGIQAGAKSWIGDILRRGITAKASASSSIDPLVYWQKLIDTEYKSLAIMALEILTVPATSAPIERVISSAGLATRGQRNKTEFELLDAQLVVNSNSWMQHM
uniref:HAT C-terminal dimerisation domain-containing protein n=1 Tax=Ditylenchus dipsaci TaxID=166011 RepID=A0A915ENK8_9BILA